MKGIKDMEKLDSVRLAIFEKCNNDEITNEQMTVLLEAADLLYIENADKSKGKVGMSILKTDKSLCVRLQKKIAKMVEKLKKSKENEKDKDKKKKIDEAIKNANDTEKVVKKWEDKLDKVISSPKKVIKGGASLSAAEIAKTQAEEANRIAMQQHEEFMRQMQQQEFIRQQQEMVDRMNMDMNMNNMRQMQQQEIIRQQQEIMNMNNMMTMGMF
jgi:hypothetical protein